MLGEGKELGEGELTDGHIDALRELIERELGDGHTDALGELADEPTNEPTDEPTDKPTNEPTGEPDQFCSSCNLRKPLSAFGRFFTCETCRRRNTKTKRRRNQASKIEIAKQREDFRPVDGLERHLQLWQEQSREHILLRHSRTRLLTLKEYLKN